MYVCVYVLWSRKTAKTSARTTQTICTAAPSLMIHIYIYMYIHIYVYIVIVIVIVIVMIITTTIIIL